MATSRSSLFANSHLRTKSPGRKLTEQFKRESSLPAENSPSRSYNSSKRSTINNSNGDKRGGSIPPSYNLKLDSLSLADNISRKSNLSDDNDTLYDKKCPSFFCDTDSVETSLIGSRKSSMNWDDDTISQCSYSTFLSGDDNESVQTEAVGRLNDEIQSNDYFQSENSYHSSIFRTVKKRKLLSVDIAAENLDCSLNNTDDFLNLSSNGIDNPSRKKLKSNPPSNPVKEMFAKLLSVIHNFVFRILKVLLIMILFILGIFLFVFSYSIWISMSARHCETQNKVHFPAIIGTNMTRCLVGHDLTIPVIIDALEKYSFNNEHLHLMWWVGQVGVGKSKASNILQNGVGDKFRVHIIISSLLPLILDDMEIEALKLVQALDPCRPNLIIFDGFDEEKSVLFIFIQNVIENLKSDQELVDSRIKIKVFIIVIGTYGDHLITEAYLNHTSNNLTRETFPFNNLQVQLNKIFPFKTSAIQNTIIPFLPLNSDHLKQCVIQELNYYLNIDNCLSMSNQILEENLKSKKLTVEYIYENVLSMQKAHFVDKQNFNNLLPFGCKQVHQLVTLLLSKSYIEN